MNAKTRSISVNLVLVLTVGLAIAGCGKNGDNEGNNTGKNLTFSESTAEGRIANMAWKYRSGRANIENDFDGNPIISFKLYSFEFTNPCNATVDGDFILGSAPNKVGEFYYQPVITPKVDKGTTLTFLTSSDNSLMNLVADEAKVRIDRIECATPGDIATCTKVVGAITGYHDSAKYGNSAISGTFEIPICASPF